MFVGGIDYLDDNRWEIRFFADKEAENMKIKFSIPYRIKYVFSCYARNDARNCTKLGIFHEGHFFGPYYLKNSKKAIKAYDKACNNGYAIACTYAGFLYTSGDHQIGHNISTVMDYHKKACDLDFNKSCEIYEYFKKENLKKIKDKIW